MKIFKKAKRGFTLVELVVVIAVIAILAAVSVGAYFGVTESANKSKLEQESKQFHTAIQTVALRGNADYTLDADGLRVSDIDKFESALEESMGQDVEVLNNDPTYIAKQTVVLKTSELVQSEEGAPVVYKTFEYYTAEISGKKIAVDVVTGDFAHANSDVVINKDGADVTNSTMFFKAPSFKTHVYAYLFSGEGENVNENAPYPGVELKTFAKVLDIYAFESSSSYEKVVFSWKDAEEETIKDGNKTEDITLPAADANTPYYDNGWKALPNIVNAETTGKIVYFNDSSYEEVYVYAFDYNENKNADWPGVLMTRDETRLDKMASYTFDKDYYTVIFNNGDNKQTKNLQLSEVDFENNKVFYNLENEEWTTIPADAEPIVPPSNPSDYSLIGTINGSNWDTDFFMTPVADLENVYEYTLEGVTVGTEFKIRYQESWDEGKSWGFSQVQQEEKYFGDKSGNINVLVEGDYNIKFDSTSKSITFTYSGENSPVTEQKVQVYYDNPNNWEKVYAYYWGGDFANTWPGSEMSLAENGLYTVEIDGSSKNIIFNKGEGGDGNQTGDLVFNSSTPYYVGGEWADSYTPPHTHTFDETGKCECNYQCPHTSYTNGSCDECNMTCSHTWEDGVCTICTLECSHETYTGGVCDTCTYHCSHETYNDGFCIECNEECEHNYNENSVCTICGSGCNHTYVEGVCSSCNHPCSHTWENGTCSTCNLICQHDYHLGVCTKCEHIDTTVRIIYLDSDGKQSDGAWFAAWTWGGAGDDCWVTFEYTGKDNIYVGIFPSDVTGMKVNRMASNVTEPNWTQGDNGYWNQTGDITIPSDKNCWKWTDWDGSTGSWSNYNG